MISREVTVGGTPNRARMQARATHAQRTQGGAKMRGSAVARTWGGQGLQPEKDGERSYGERGEDGGHVAATT